MLGPSSPMPDPDPDINEDQQPLLLDIDGTEEVRGSQRLGDVELRIPLRLQKMKAASAKKQVIHRPYFTILISALDVILMMYVFPPPTTLTLLLPFFNIICSVEIIVNKGFESFKVRFTSSSLAFLCLLFYSSLFSTLFASPLTCTYQVNPWIGVSAETLLKLGGKFTPLIVNENQWWRYALKHKINSFEPH